MPGLNLLASARPLDGHERSVFDCAQQAMLHFPSYDSHLLASRDRIAVGLTAWRGYPRQQWDTPDGFAIVEGAVYNAESIGLERRLKALIADRALDLAQRRQSLAALAADADGEFLIVCFDAAAQQLLVANDTLGRLPTFCAATGGRLLISREPKFIYPFLRAVAFNRFALMAHLLFGFTFGRDTLVDGISQLEAATVLSYDTRTGELRENVTYPYELEADEWSGRSRVLATMCELFLASTARRAMALRQQPLVVSLSGGLDSRAVLARAVADHPSVHAVTVGDTPEIELAQRLAALYGVSLEIVSPRESNETIDARSVALKDGLDSHGIQAQLHACLAQVARRHGSAAVLVTGTYGGEITRYLHPTANIASTDRLARFLLSAGDAYKYSTSQTARILDLSPRETTDYLLSHLESFPERTPYGKYRRFRHEYDRKYAGNGEDRNRFYFWTTAPFASPPLYRFAASLNENRKNVRLFRDFLFSLDPRLCSIPYYNFNVALDGGPKLRLLSIAERVARFAAVKTTLQRLNERAQFLRRHETEALGPLRRRVLDMLERAGPAAAYIDTKATRQIVGQEHDARGLWRLQILLLYVEWAPRFTAGVHAATAASACHAHHQR